MEDGKTEEPIWFVEEERGQTPRSHVAFESVPLWKDARRLVHDIYGLTGQPPFARDRSFCDQLRRAAISVMNNIAEGYERGSEVELARFLYIAKGSCGEVRSMLYAARDLNFVSVEASDDVYQLCLGISRQLAGFIRHLEAKRLNTARSLG